MAVKGHPSSPTPKQQQEATKNEKPHRRGGYNSDDITKVLGGVGGAVEPGGSDDGMTITIAPFFALQVCAFAEVDESAAALPPGFCTPSAWAAAKSGDCRRFQTRKRKTRSDKGKKRKVLVVQTCDDSGDDNALQEICMAANAPSADSSSSSSGASSNGDSNSSASSSSDSSAQTVPAQAVQAQMIRNCKPF